MTNTKLRCTHLYVATDHRFHKIGMTSNVRRRIPQLRSPYYRKVELVESWHRPKDAPEIESIVKGVFAHKAVLGREWFDVSREEILAMMRKVFRVFDHENAVKSRRAAKNL